MAEDSKRLQILKRLTALLEGIVPANGYTYDLAGRVYRGRGIFGEETPAPLVSILEAPRDATTLTVGMNDTGMKASWDLLLQGWTEDDKVNPTDPVYALADEVEKRLMLISSVEQRSGGRPAIPVDPEQYMLGGLLSGMRKGEPVVRPTMEGVSSKAFFWLPVTLEYVRVF